MTPTRIGILGCGNVSHMYAPVLTRVSGIEVTAVADVVRESADRLVEKFEGLPAPVDPDQLIADPNVDIVLNLTPIVVHVEVTRAALNAGKHVYSEKPLASSLTEAIELVELADQRGLALACAPDTLLGTGFQASRAALASGSVGAPLAASGFMFRSAMPEGSWYAEGTTPFFDMAPYYVSALVNLLGAIVSVSGSNTTRSKATPATGGKGELPIAIAGTLEFESGLFAELIMAWGADYRHEVPVLTVYGTEGVLQAPNPNNFGDPAFTRKHGETEWTEVPDSRQPERWPRNLRGLGVGEMALAIKEGRKPRSSGELGCHTVEVIEGLVRSAETGQRVELTTRCEPAEPFDAGTRDDLLG